MANSATISIATLSAWDNAEHITMKAPEGHDARRPMLEMYVYVYVYVACVYACDICMCMCRSMCVCMSRSTCSTCVCVCVYMYVGGVGVCATLEASFGVLLFP